MRNPFTWLAIVSLPAILLAVAYAGQRWLVYYPDRRNPGSAASRFASGHDVTLTTSDGLALGAWLFEPTTESRDAAILYAPGNGGNRLDRAEVAQSFAAAGFTVLLLEYRGYGGNLGKPSEAGLLADARAGVEFLEGIGFPTDRMIYVGESLGTGVATSMAIEQPPAGLVLRSPYTSIADMAVKSSGGLPIGGLVHDRFDTISRINKVDVPTVVLSGDADMLVPASQSAAVADAAANLHREIIVPGAGHNHEGWFGRDLVDPVVELADELGL